jgi:hypothetical protein
MRNTMQTRHCFKCGWEWKLSGEPGRSDTCPTCGNDLRVCLSCVHYDRSVAHQCRERRADPVLDKDRSNFCEYFEMARRIFRAAGTNSSREDSARDQLKKLLGD